MSKQNEKGGARTEQLTSTRPYLIRAIYQWALDNALTPYLVVNTEHEQVSVPRAYAKDGQMALNIHPQAIRQLELGDTFVTCSARFAGRACELFIPVVAVWAIYAKENGEGMVFHAPSMASLSPTPPASVRSREDKRPKRAGSTRTSSKTPSARLRLIE